MIATGSDVISRAVQAAARHGLRAYDAVQLATALLTRDALGRLDEFASFDRQLRQAAAAEAFELVPASLEGCSPLGARVTA